MASLKLCQFAFLVFFLLLDLGVDSRYNRRRNDRRRPHRDPVDGSPPGPSVSRGLSLSEEARRLVGDYATSNSRFAVDLYTQMAGSADNFAISPLSIHSALSMLVIGASGTTKRELVRGLHIRSPIHQGFKAYNQTIAAQGEEVSGDDDVTDTTTLMMANAIYTRPNLRVKRGFMRKLQNFYQTSVSQFAENNPEEEINDWVSEKTMGMIDGFLSDGEISSDVVMMLLNAVYFKGTWKYEFDESHTRLQTFTDQTGQEHDVDMMTLEGNLRLFHSSTLRARALRLPYKGDRYSLNIILPDEGVALSRIESQLNYGSLNGMLNTLNQQRSTRVALSMPKFSLDTQRSLQELLEALGISEIFGEANFRRMTTYRDLYVSKVKHRCIFETDEEGTEAAAITSISISSRSSAVARVEHFNVNKPFIFVLSDDAASVNLFMGRYTNPQGDNIMN